MHWMYSCTYMLHLLLVLKFEQVSSQAWLQTPYTNDSFNVEVKYGENTTLKCEDQRIKGAYEVQFWVLPELTTLGKSATKSFETIDGTSTWAVHSNGMNLDIDNINDRMFGFYHCIVSVSSNHYVIKKAVNYRGAYYGDLWPEYRRNVIIGGSAAGGALLLATVVMVVYYYFYRDEDTILPQNDPAQEDVDFPTISGNTTEYQNAAFSGKQIKEDKYDNVPTESQTLPLEDATRL